MPSAKQDEIRQLLDREEIRQLMYKYGHKWDNLDFEGWADVFTEDGTYWEGGGPVIKGREALISYAEDTGPRFSGRFHIVANQYVDVDGDTAKAHSYFLIVEGLNPCLSGTYDDEVVRTRDGWRFAKRVVTCLFPAGFPIAGNDMAAWMFSPSAGGGWQHRSQWRANQYHLPGLV
jgi:ketosteroid isomerase-like protein